MCVYVCAHVCYFFNLIYYYYIYNFALEFFFFLWVSATAYAWNKLFPFKCRSTDT